MEVCTALGRNDKKGTASLLAVPESRKRKQKTSVAGVDCRRSGYRVRDRHHVENLNHLPSHVPWFPGRHLSGQVIDRLVGICRATADHIVLRPCQRLPSSCLNPDSSFCHLPWCFLPSNVRWLTIEPEFSRR